MTVRSEEQQIERAREEMREAQEKAEDAERQRAKAEAEEQVVIASERARTAEMGRELERLTSELHLAMGECCRDRRCGPPTRCEQRGGHGARGGRAAGLTLRR